MLRWKSTLIASWLAQICSIIGFALVMPFLPLYVRSLGVPTEKAVLLWSGWLISGAGVTMAIVAPMWGVLADRYGRKLMVMRSMLGGVLVLGLMAYVTSVYQLLALRILQGILTGTVTASVALVASVVPMRRAGFAMGLMQQAVFIGNAIGPLIGGMAADHFGYRVPFLIAAGFLVLAAGLTWFGVHEDFDADEMDAGADGVTTLRGVLSITGVSTLIGLLFMVHFSGAFIGPILPLYLERLGSHTNTTTGFVFALGAVSAAVAAPVIGLLGDRVGYASILRACTFLNGVLLIPQGLVRTVPQLAVLRMAFSFSDVGTMPTANALIRRLVPRHACGKAFSLVQSVTCFGWGLGPICGSALAARFGMRVPFFIVGGVFLIISVFVAIIIPKMMAQIEAGEAQAEGTDVHELIAETAEYERGASQGGSQD